MSRNKKTGNARGYAFMEFQHAEVAAVAADAMNGYFMFTRQLVCRVLREDEVHPLLFKNGNRKCAGCNLAKAQLC